MLNSPEAGHPIRILVIEDHAQLRTVVARSLTGMGYTALVAESADVARQQLIEGLDVDLIFTDVRMPGLIHGLDLARWAREHRPTVRVLLQTGNPNIDTEGFAVLYKPYTGEDLENAIRTALGAGG